MSATTAPAAPKGLPVTLRRWLVALAVLAASFGALNAVGAVLYTYTGTQYAPTEPGGWLVTEEGFEISLSQLTRPRSSNPALEDASDPPEGATYVFALVHLRWPAEEPESAYACGSATSTLRLIGAGDRRWYQTSLVSSNEEACAEWTAETKTVYLAYLVPTEALGELVGLAGYGTLSFEGTPLLRPPAPA
jgi:hypothetical protein